MNISTRVLFMNVGLSALIGVIIAYVIISLLGKEPNHAFLIITGAVTGVIIGGITRYTVLFLLRYTWKTPFLAYLSGLFVAGLLTYASATGFAQNIRLILVAIVEPLVLITIFINIRYYERLNASLKRRQDELSDSNHP